MKTKEQLEQYATKMLRRGDSFRSIVAYLIANCEEETIVKVIVLKLDRLQAKEQIETRSVKKNSSCWCNFRRTLHIRRHNNDGSILE